jgi:phospholipid-binding lipoprotein MlaA
MTGKRLAMRLAPVLLALSGCASQGVIFHRLPPETPAADNAAAIKQVQALMAQSKAAAEGSVNAKQSDAQEAPPVTPAEAPSMATYDPWARLNRFTYRFNARFDEALFLPVANSYRRLPSPLRAGVNNFFGNLTEVDSVINYTLQGRLGRSAKSLGRFVINSTLGIGGLFDVASRLQLPRAPTGFATTLSQWGMHPGPYAVIPFYGPSTLREAIGLAADYGASYGVNVADLYRGAPAWGLGTLNAVDQRANIDFRYYSTGSPFEYDTISFLYVRKLLIEDAALHPPKQRNPSVPAGK